MEVEKEKGLRRVETLFSFTAFFTAMSGAAGRN
jgi:hypothetical protein